MDDTLQSWNSVGLPPELTTPGAATPFIQSVIRVHATGTIVMAGYGGDAVTAVWRQTSGSSAWTKDSTDFAGIRTPAMCLVEADDGTLFMVVNAGLHKSSDDGNSWSVLKPAGTGPQAYFKYFTAKGGGGPGLPSMFANFVRMGPSVSQDNGQTWTALTGLSGALPGKSQRSWVARLPDGTYLVATTTGLFHSTDATGVSYKQETFPSGFSGIECLATGDNFAWLVLDNDFKGPYLYKRNTDVSYHPDLTGLLTLLATAKDTGSYNILNISPAAFEYYTQYGVFWGVDSITKATDSVGSGTFFDAVAAQASNAGGTAPAFWGRYIGPHNGNLLQAEADFLHANNCRVLLIYNDTYYYLDKGNVTRVTTYADGVFHAAQAIRYITANPNPDPAVGGNYPGLNVPANKSVWVYLNTEIGTNPVTKKPFPVLTSDFYRGWLDTMLGSSYGGAGGVYGNTLTAQDAAFTTPYCQAYSASITGISFMQTDTAANGNIGCMIKQYFHDPVGEGADLTSGRQAIAGGILGSPGGSAVTEMMNPSELEDIYVMWEITPGPNVTWRAGNWTIRLNVTSPNVGIVWKTVEIVRVDQNCNGIEDLGFLPGQSVSLKSTGVLSLVVPGNAPASVPAPGDKVLVLLAFANGSKNEFRSFSYTPNQLIDSPFTRVGAVLYANQPQQVKICDATNRTFSPALPDSCNAPVVIYQYTTGTGSGCTVTGAGPTQMVDYDLANGAGFAGMW